METPDQNFSRLLDLQKLTTLLSEVERNVYFPSSSKAYRPENDTEHSYTLAIVGWYLVRQFPALNCDLVIKYALVHDLVEVYAGDVDAVRRTPKQESIKQQREAEALATLQHEWSDFTDLTDLMENYEARHDPESRFVYALDKIMPIILVLTGGGETWRKENMTMTELFAAKDEKLKLSPEINAIWREIRQHISKNQQTFFATKATKQKPLYFCTTNRDKFSLAEKVFEAAGIHIEQLPQDCPEIQSENPHAILEHKARTIYQQVNSPLFVTDDSWEVPALGGFPGPYMKSANHWLAPQDWLNLMQPHADKRIILRPRLAYIDNTGITYFEDEQEFVFMETPSKIGDVKIQTIIRYPDHEKSIAEMMLHHHDDVASREQIWHKLTTWLKQH